MAQQWIPRVGCGALSLERPEWYVYGIITCGNITTAPNVIAVALSWLVTRMKNSAGRSLLSTYTHCVYTFMQVRHRPEDGIIDTVVEVPVPNVTCCALGGPNLTTLYITTTRRKMSEDELASQPEAGSLFAVDVPIQGLPEPEVILRA